MEIKILDTINEDIIYIRSEVFIKEQGFKEEFDTIDKHCHFALISIDQKAVACGRTYLKSDGVYAIGRVAVLKSYRKQYLGSQIIDALEKRIIELGGKEIVLSAQLQAQSFYEKLGYLAIGEPYLDEHCLHIQMIKKL